MSDAIGSVVRDVAEDPVFLLAAVVAAVSALLMVTRRNPVYAALWLMQCFLSVAVIFLKLDAPFLAAIHVLVYTGAILVLFLFVIMLLNLQPRELGAEHSRPAKGLALTVCGVLFLLLTVSLFKGPPHTGPYPALAKAEVRVGEKTLSFPAEEWGGVRHVGAELFSQFKIPFEIVSVLIVVAILGAVVLAKRKL